MPVLSHLHHLFNANSAKPTSIHSGGKIVPFSVPGARVRTSIRGGRRASKLWGYPISPG